MASKFYFKLICAALIMAVCLAAFPHSVSAAASHQGTDINEHPFKFYLDPTLVPDMNVAKSVLVKYVDDMNFILAKNTNRRLVFNPNLDIILTSTQPQSNQAASPLPLEGFEIWTHAIHTTYPVSYGGYAGLNDNGAGVLAGLKWTRLYDPDQLKSAAEVTDYWTQINNMLHELAHVFGAGIGEYYNLSAIQDATGVSPLLNINVYDQDDSFWGDKLDFMADPLLQNAAGRFSSRIDLLEYVRYSGLTAAILNNDYRNGAPQVDLSRVNIQVVANDGTPIENARIDIWAVEGTSLYPAHLITEADSNGTGGLSFAWGGSSNNPHNGYDFLRLIKVYKEGYIATAKYISIYDADIAKLVHGSDFLDVNVQLDKAAAAAPANSSFADVLSTDFAMPFIEKMYSYGITGGCSSSPLLYCPEQSVTRAQMAVFLERGLKGSGFSPNSVITASFADVPANSFASPWIEQMVSDGISSGCGGGNFCPDQPVTRAQMAIFILRAKYGASYIPSPASGIVFEDVPVNYWAASWLEQFGREGITSGCGNGSYCPDMPVTRSQMAVFLTRALNLQ